jgi:hypothetical protein
VTRSGAWKPLRLLAGAASVALAIGIFTFSGGNVGGIIVGVIVLIPGLAWLLSASPNARK